MTTTITIGMWVMPTLLTILSFIWAYSKRDTGGGNYLDFSGMFDLIYYGIATIISLISWLVWSLL